MTTALNTDDRTERRLIDWLSAQKANMVDLLADLVNTDSGSYDKQGVDRAGSLLHEFFDRHGLQVRVVPMEDHGDILRASLGEDEAPVLLMGHRDTVFDKGEAARRPFSMSKGRAYGPGVADMKAGLVVNAFTAAAFAQLDKRPCDLVVLVTGDEEIASPSSRRTIEKEAQRARACFNSEPARLPWKVVTRRKGGVFSEITVRGKAAHSGADFAKGVSAIEELARKVIALHALNTGGEATINVGTIRGGVSVNTVAPIASAKIDLRYARAADRDGLVSAIEEIARTCSVPGASGEFKISGEFLPLEEGPDNLGLFELYRSVAAELGQEVERISTGGCADSGFSAAMGCPTLCAVGPSGAGGHTEDEFIELDTLVPSAQVLAATIARLPIAH